MGHSVEVEHSDKRTTFKVRDGKQPVGRLCVSKGGLVWKFARGWYGRQLTWNEFEQAILDNGRRGRFKYPK